MFNVRSTPSIRFQLEKRLDAVVRICADALTCAAAILLALFVRIYLLTSYNGQLTPASIHRLFRFFLLSGPFLVALVCGGAWALGLYGSSRSRPFYEKIPKVSAVIGLAASTFFTVVYFIHLQQTYRSTLTLFWVLCWAGLLSSRLLLYQLQHHYYVEPHNKNSRRENDRVLVIGGAGYLGSVLVRQLLERGYHVRVLDRLIFGDEPIRELYSRPRFEMIQGDFRHAESVVEAIRGVTSVVHLGAIVGDPACALNNEATLSNNFYATKLVHEVCRGFGVRRFIFASTCSVYGASTEVMTENSPVVPVSLYAATKLDCERIVLSHCDTSFNPVVLRFATVFGLSFRPRFDLVVNLFAAQAYFEGRLRVFNPDQYRPFIHTRDVGCAIIGALEADSVAVRGQVFNIGSDRINHSIGQVGEMFRAAVPGLIVDVEKNQSDPRSYRVSFEKCATRLGFECETDLPAGIEELLSAFRSGEIQDYRRKEYSNHHYLKEIGFDDGDARIAAVHSEQFLAARRAASA